MDTLEETKLKFRFKPHNLFIFVSNMEVGYNYFRE